MLKIFTATIALLAAVIGLSALSQSFMPEKPEGTKPAPAITLQPGMTVEAIGIKYGIPAPVLAETFKLEKGASLSGDAASFGMTEKEINKRLARSYALAKEEGGKDWIKIAVKFALWFLFMGYLLLTLLKGGLGKKKRIILYVAAVALFGAILGSDPSPMGTVKDALVLYGKSGAIFPPRLIAMTVFLLTVFIANKFICSWGCQFGTLQDLIFRINRDKADRKGILPQVKIPFSVTNGVRIVLFAVFSVIAAGWGVDIIKPVDPFGFFNPLALSAIAASFIGFLLVLSLFVYRPWCHLFCPFGLAGWVVEKFSIFRIRVNREKCIDCKACVKACPSTVMGAILNDERVIPDCFSCATCMDACPTGALTFGKRGAAQNGDLKSGGEKEGR